MSNLKNNIDHCFIKKTSIHKSMHDRNKQMSTGEIKRKLARKKQRHRIHNKKKT